MLCTSLVSAVERCLSVSLSILLSWSSITA